jgi:hypothetical protein
LSDRAQPLFPLRVGYVWENGQRTRKEAFDNLDGKPMFLALGPVAPVPVETVRLQGHANSKGMQLYRQMSMVFPALLTLEATGSPADFPVKYLFLNDISGKLPVKYRPISS